MIFNLDKNPRNKSIIILYVRRTKDKFFNLENSHIVIERFFTDTKRPIKLWEQVHMH